MKDVNACLKFFYLEKNIHIPILTSMKRKTIIISDLHLWTPDAQPEKLLKFLEKNPTKKLIMNWDMIDRLYIKYIRKRKPEHQEVLEKIEGICKKNKTEMIYLEGNHERWINKPKRIPTQKEITLTSHWKKYIVCGGDNLWAKKKEISGTEFLLFLTDTFFWRLDKTLGTNYKISNFLKNIYNKITSQKNSFNKKIIKYTKEKKHDWIICGHTHTATDKTIWGIHYLNSWDRTETCSALIEDEKWNWKIHYW